MAELVTATENAAAASDEVESKIRAAVLSRVPYFREQADSLTFMGVRRVLEEDLGLEKYALDPHKRFVKNYLEECLEAAKDGQVSKSAEDDGAGAKLGGGVPPRKNEKESNTAGGQIMGESPVRGLMTGDKKTKGETDENQHAETDVLSEIKIKEAISKRASHLRENSGNITMAGVRRLLEEDLKLEKYALDPFKKFISEHVDEVFASSEILERAADGKKANSRKSSHGKASNNSVEEESSHSSENDSGDVEENDVKKRKVTIPRRKVQSPAEVKKRKRDEVDKRDSNRKSKVSKTKSQENGEKDGSEASENENSESSAEKLVQKKEVAKPSYGKRVEHLKSVIKSCGMSVPPSVYKKVKQAPETKREGVLMKELEEILAKEGLSANPSEKEIKEVKKRKDRAKELEGIDTSNIVFSSRRRSTMSFAPPPKPTVPVKSDIETSEDDDVDNDNDNDNGDEEEDDDQEDDGEDGQSEEDEEEDNEEDDGEDGQSEEDEDSE